MYFDHVTHVPMWLDVSHPPGQVLTTLALLRAGLQARPQQVRIDVYAYANARLFQMTVRN